MPAEQAHHRRIQLLSVINGLLGLWLIASPWVLGVSNAAIARSEIVAGILITLFAIARFRYRGSAFLSWANIAAAAWAALAPWLFAHASLDRTTWGSAFAGVVIAAIETVSLTASSLRPAGTSQTFAPRPGNRGAYR